jgi:hypothetical protein
VFSPFNLSQAKLERVGSGLVQWCVAKLHSEYKRNLQERSVLLPSQVTPTKGLMEPINSEPSAVPGTTVVDSTSRTV